MTILDTKNLNLDKPSLNWSKFTHKKILKQIIKNDNFNSSNTHPYKKVPNYYSISWFHFLPLFLGWFASIFSLGLTWGFFKSSAIFNKKLYRHFLLRYLICLLFHFVFGPLLFFLILFLSPLFNVDKNLFFKIWHSFSFYNLDEWIKIFSENIIQPFFNQNGWYLCLIILFFIPIFNFLTIINYFILNKKNDFYMQMIFLEDDLKIKLSSLRRKK